MTKELALAQPAPRVFRAPTMAEALTAVQHELGPEALIVSVRRAPGGPAWQIWRKPVVEVAALPAVPAAPAARPQPRPAPAPQPRPAARPAASAAQPGHYAEKAAQIQALLEEINARRAPAPAPERPADAPPAPAVTAAPAALPEVIGEWRQKLLGQGVDAERLAAVVAACEATLGARAQSQPQRVRDHLQRQMEADVRVWGSAALAAAAAAPGKARVICLVGPSGSGKTTAAAKLAALHTRTHGLRVAWVCADTFRAGAIAQARVYAEALKLPLRVAYTGPEVAQAVAAEREADLILVDLPGANARRESDLVEVGELLAAVPGRLTCLVAPATAKDDDLTDALAAFGMFDLKGLLVTKLDETRSVGNVYNLAWRSRLPLMYFAMRPGALDGLQPASAHRLVNALFEPAEGLLREG